MDTVAAGVVTWAIVAAGVVKWVANVCCGVAKVVVTVIVVVIGTVVVVVGGDAFGAGDGVIVVRCAVIVMSWLSI